MLNYRKSFSLIEIIFTIVILAVIATIALPRLFSTTNENSFIQLKSDIATIQNALFNYKKNAVLQNLPQTLDSLDEDNINLFNKILKHPIIATNEYPFWSKNSQESYIFHFSQKEQLEFTYNSSEFTFSCDKHNALCQKVLQ